MSDGRGRWRRPLRERFEAKYVVDEETGCWVWIGTKTSTGYGVIHEGGVDNDGGKRLRAHRVSYEMHVGPIPEGYTLDHTCHTNAVPSCKDGDKCRHRLCVNPAHLEPVTRAENVRRGEPAQRTHCPRGHAYTPENTYRHPSTGRARRCRECTRIRNRERYDAAREKAA